MSTVLELPAATNHPPHLRHCSLADQSHTPTSEKSNEPHLKREYHHAMMIHVKDSLDQTLLRHMEETGETLRLKCFSCPTTVENLAHQLFTEITEMGFRLSSLEIRETDTSVVSYTREDWVNDNRYFASCQKPESESVS